MSYSIEALADSCYPGSTCLINKLGIRNEEQLAFVESRIVLGKTEELWKNPIRGHFDFNHYKAIHRYLFEDIYAWAGEIRTVDMSKKGTRFIPASQINDMAKRVFDRLNRMNNLVGQAQDDFVVNVTDFYCSTNMLHPFREGNGRTQRAFLQQLIRNAGYDLRFSEIDPDELMIATIQAANGINDSLLNLFREHITPYQEGTNHA